MLAPSPSAELARINLSGNSWFLRPVPQGTDQSAAPQGDLTAPDWLPAQVPGNIQADLESAHELTPLWYGEGDPRLWDVARKDWWYATDFDAPAALEGKRTTLVFDGVDFECEVYLNGRRLGANKGMFRRFWFDASSAMLPGRTNRLAVRIARMPEECLPFLKNSDGKMSGGETEFFFVYANNKIRRVLKDLKSPANCSYDWGTNIWTLGIWKEVHLLATGAARIDWLQVQTRLANEYRQTTVLGRIETDCTAPTAVQATFTVKGHGTSISATVKQQLAAGNGVVEAELLLENPALWWPYGSGEQPLYTLNVALNDATTGELLDSRTTRFGVREIRWEQVEGAPADFLNPYRLVLNGRTIRTMGSNLVSPDLLFGRNFARGDWFIRMARFGGMNMLRLHGGGVTLPDRMYALADELGIMISHEFPIANCRPEDDPEFLANLDQTVRNIVKQVRNHPSIIEYSGGNEMNWKQGDDYAALHVMERATAEEDNRFFRATCPIQGSRHSPWHYDRKVSYTHYDNELLNDNLEQNRLMRYGEFGSHTPSNIEVWHRDIPPASQWPIDSYDDPVLVRKNVVQAVFSDEFWLVPSITEDLFGLIPDLETMIKAGQFIGAEGLRYSMDALRRRGRRCGGFTNWDYNEPWPNGAGSFVIDYDGRTLMNFDFVKQALAPVALNVKQETILYDPKQGLKVEFWLVSDASDTMSVQWQWLARDRRGNAFAQKQGKATINSVEALNLGAELIAPPAATALGPLLLELQVRDSQGQLLSERVHVFGCAGIHGSLGGLLKQDQPDPDDDAPPAPKNAKAPANPANLAFVGNGASPAVVSGAECTDFNAAHVINDGEYHPSQVWNATHPGASFQIDLGKLATVGLFKVGRDRCGFMKDRTLDRIKIELSSDGASWQTVFEQDRLAALIGDRAPASHMASWGPIVDTLSEYENYRPTWTLEISIAPTQARHVKVTVDPRPGAEKFTAIDEFEVYAPQTEATGSLPSFRFVDAKELNRPVKRTQLNVVSKPLPSTDTEETLAFEITNTGAMTALFVEPHPMLNYRTDIMIENKNVCIPPGESRTLVIRSVRGSACGLSLAQTGWRITSWNADEVTLPPCDTVLLAIGRQDAMTREFAAGTAPAKGTITVRGNLPPAAEVPYLLATGNVLRAEFTAPVKSQGKAARLRLHTADQSNPGPQVVCTLNGHRFTAALPAGIALQRENPAHLAYPASVAITLPADSIKGENVLEIALDGQGWFTWDALDLVQS
jgi:beta-mannosidase